MFISSIQRLADIVKKCRASRRSVRRALISFLERLDCFVKVCEKFGLLISVKECSSEIKQMNPTLRLIWFSLSIALLKAMRCIIKVVNIPQLVVSCKQRIPQISETPRPSYVAARYDPQCLIQRSYGSLQVVRISHDFIPNTQNVTKVH